MGQSVFILGGKRTPMGEYVGALKDISAALGQGKLEDSLMVANLGLIANEPTRTAERLLWDIRWARLERGWC